MESWWSTSHYMWRKRSHQALGMLFQDNVFKPMEELMLVPFLVVGFMTVQVSSAQCQTEESTCGFRWDWDAARARAKGANAFWWAMTSDGKWIVSVGKQQHEISLFSRETRAERLIQLEEKEMITSFSLSRDNKYLLIDLVTQEIQLWVIGGDETALSLGIRWTQAYLVYFLLWWVWWRFHR